MGNQVQDWDEEELVARHARRVREMRRRKKRQARRREILKKRVLPLALLLVLVICLLSGGVKAVRRGFGKTPAASGEGELAGVERIESTAGESGLERRTAGDGINGGDGTEDMTDGDGENGAGIQGAAAGNTQSGAMRDTAGEAETETETKAPAGAAGETETKAPAGTAGGAAAGNRVYSATAGDSTVSLGADSDIESGYAVLIDLSEDRILAQKGAKTVINPASMTKVLTVLVAAEHIKSLDDKVTITNEIIDYCFKNDCSNAGFAEGETVTVRDLFYGAILPSGAEAALGLAVYAAGSQEAFVELMNDKIRELGLSQTAHVTNCVGLYDSGHHCTVYDMAMIMEAAMQNDLCREVMSAHIYTTSKTEEHPEGIELSNWFLRRIEDKDSGAEVVCGKTGYVVQSGNCAVSYAVDSGGKGYICVTADAGGGWKCIYDHVAVYKKYIP